MERNSSSDSRRSPSDQPITPKGESSSIDNRHLYNIPKKQQEEGLFPGRFVGERA
jgi:hypothetical protein